MSKEIQVLATTASVVYAQIVRSSDGKFWNTSGTPAFETYATANIANYAITMTEAGTSSGVYTGNFPTGISSGRYSVICRMRAGGAPAESDLPIAVGDIVWDGAQILGSQSLPRNRPYTAFKFPMVLAADGTAATGKSVTCMVCIDGGAFVASTNAVSEVGSGWYKIDLAAADLNGKDIALLLTASACKALNLKIVTQD